MGVICRPCSELRQLLDDFQIHTEIPEFDSRQEMELWQRNILRE